MAAVGHPGNRAAFARALGYEDNPAQVAKNWFARDKGLPDSVRKPLAQLGLSLDWINDGDGEMLIGERAVASTAIRSSYVRAEQLAAEGDMGDGAINDEVPEVIRAIDYTPSYIRGLMGFVPPPGRLALITGRGNSMMPVIQPGDSVLVDMGIKEFDGDGLYLINSGRGEQIKALQDRGGIIYVVSADKVLFPAYEATQETRILGKVYLKNRIERLS